jgi:hypothetical protein
LPIREARGESPSLEVSTENPVKTKDGEKRFYEKVIKVKADVAALLNLFSDFSIDVRW